MMQTKDPYNSYSLLLDRTARRVKQFAQQQFREMGFDITVDQWLVMKHLDENGPLIQTDLAEMLAKDNPTLTRIVDILCRKKYTVRRPDPADRRCFVLELTAAGRKKVGALRPRITGIRLQAWQGLSDKDFSQFTRILNRIYSNLA